MKLSVADRIRFLEQATEALEKLLLDMPHEELRANPEARKVCEVMDELDAQLARLRRRQATSIPKISA